MASGQHPSVPQAAGASAAARWAAFWLLPLLILHLPFLTPLPFWPFLLGSLALAVAASRWPLGDAFLVTACYWLGAVLATVAGLGYPWHVLLPLGLMMAWPRLRRQQPLWWGGPLQSHWYAWGLGVALAAALVLYGWLGRHLETQHVLRTMLPDWSLGGLVGLAVAFALFNAWLEETVYRGFYQQALLPLGLWPAIVVQGVIFGALHVVGGVPSGIDGGLLAAAFGIVMGWLAHRTGSLRVPILAHAIADLAIMLTVILSPT